jgi:hypothetical protein
MVTSFSFAILWSGEGITENTGGGETKKKNSGRVDQCNSQLVGYFTDTFQIPGNAHKQTHIYVFNVIHAVAV